MYTWGDCIIVLFVLQSSKKSTAWIQNKLAVWNQTINLISNCKTHGVYNNLCKPTWNVNFGVLWLRLHEMRDIKLILHVIKSQALS